MERDRALEQLAQAQGEAREARAEANAYRQQIAALAGQEGSRDGMIVNLTTQNAELQKQLEEMNRRYAEAIGMAGRAGTALPQELSNELTRFAAQNADLVEFDESRGIVKFKSDVTFASGSAEVRSEAKQAINRFAQILNSSSARGHELMVAGHTDNTRVVNPRTIEKGHKDNWYLSAHRAIAVGAELRGQGVNSQRIGVVGYADQRPVASNNSESGRAQNRRVEVLILPTQVRGGAVAGGGSAGSSSRPERDTAVTDTGPALNK